MSAEATQQQAEEPARDGTSTAGAAVASGQTARSVHFRPLLPNAHAAKGKHQSFLSHIGLNFNLSSFMSFYPLLRFTGYTFEAAYSPMNRALEYTHFCAMRKMAKKEPLSAMEKATRYVYGDVIPGTDINFFADATAWNEKTGQENDIYAPQKKGGKTSEGALRNEELHNKYGKNYKPFFNRLESGVFTTLAAVHSYDNYQQLKETCKLAVAAELGKAPMNITFTDLRGSNNPMVVSAMDRFLWQTPLRLIGGAAFWKSLWMGIVANSLVISAERTVFYRPIAYDILSKAVNDIQINSLGTEAKGELVDNLIRVMQAQRFDHRQAMIPREQVDALRPTLETIADDVINKRFGITGMMYIMGGGVLVPDDPAQSQANYQHVREVGVSGVMEEARHIRRQTHAPSTKIWEAQLAENSRSRDEGYIAESARRDELIRERRTILSRGPLHSAPGSDIDPAARYGAGIQIY